jgi:hypothetical protein
MAGIKKTFAQFIFQFIVGSADYTILNHYFNKIIITQPDGKISIAFLLRLGSFFIFGGMKYFITFPFPG